MTTAYFITADLSYAPLLEVSDFEAMHRETDKALDAMARE